MKPFLLAALLVGLQFHAPVRAADPPFDLVPVADGIYAALKPAAGRFNDSNSVILVGPDGVLVVDTQTLPETNQALIDQIRKLTDKPVRLVVNTHWHGDHTQGNFVYRREFPGVQFIGHDTLLQDIPERAATQLQEDNEKLSAALDDAEKRLAGEGDPLTDEERQDLQGRVERSRKRWAEFQTVKFIPPTMALSGEMTLFQGDREIRVLYRPGHTRGDLVLYLPKEKLLLTGDLVDDLPYGGHGVPSAWIRSLRSLDELDFETMISGHGGIKKGKEHLHLITRLVQSILDQVAAAVAEGLDLKQTIEKVNLEEFRKALVTDDLSGRVFDFFMPAAVERAFKEAKGEKLE